MAAERIGDVTILGEPGPVETADAGRRRNERDDWLARFARLLTAAARHRPADPARQHPGRRFVYRCRDRPTQRQINIVPGSLTRPARVSGAAASRSWTGLIYARRTARSMPRRC